LGRTEILLGAEILGGVVVLAASEVLGGAALQRCDWVQ